MRGLKTFFVFLFFAFRFIAEGQNLVLNPGFESYGVLPCTWIGTQADFSASMNTWTMPTQGTTDVFSDLVPSNCYASCYSTNLSSVGRQAPHSGNIMSAIVTYGAGCNFQPDYREYLQVPLTMPLIAGHTYYASMYVSLADRSDYASNNIGMFFSSWLINDPTNCTEINVVPQVNELSVITDTSGWVLVSGLFVAQSPASYLLIGNFYDNSSTIAQPVGGPSVNCRYFIDDVLVYDSIAPPDPEIIMPNVFTPGSDGVNDLFVPVKMEGIKTAEMKIYNRWGQVVFETHSLTAGWNGREWSKEFSDGTYYWVILGESYYGKSIEQHGYVTLISEK